MDTLFRRAASSCLFRTGAGVSSTSSSLLTIGSWHLTSLIHPSGSSSSKSDDLQTCCTNARLFSTGRNITANASSQIGLASQAEHTQSPTSASAQHSSSYRHSPNHPTPAASNSIPASATSSFSQTTNQAPGLSAERSRLFQTSANAASPSQHIITSSSASLSNSTNTATVQRLNHPPSFPGPFNVPPSMLSQEILAQVRDSIFGVPIEPLERTGRRALAKPLQGAELASWYFLPPKETPGFHNEEYEHSLIKAQMKRRRKEEEEGAPERKKKKKK